MALDIKLWWILRHNVLWSTILTYFNPLLIFSMLLQLTKETVLRGNINILPQMQMKH